jgi:tRNA pseudouridine13 synthase
MTVTLSMSNLAFIQRFGSGSVPTHLIGAALLRGEWKNAVELILNPREGDILVFHFFFNHNF